MTELRIALIAAALSTAVVAAHHSFAAEYDAKNQITIVGTITKVDWTKRSPSASAVEISVTWTWR